MTVLLLIVGLLLFIGLVVAHEWGHFIMARRNGVEVEEFGIFFPPRLFKHKTKGGWLFTINLLPLGGFVKMKGEHDSDTEKGTFGAASLAAKTKIMAAGVVVNLILGVLLLMIVSLIGMPKIIDNQFTVASDTKTYTKGEAKVLISGVVADSPAAKAGLKTGDTVKAIGKPGAELKQIKTADDLTATSKKLAGQQVVITYERDGKAGQGTTTVTPEAEVQATKNSAKPKRYLGVQLSQISGITLQRSTWSAPVVALGLTGQFTVLTFQGLGHAIAGLGSILAGAATGNNQARTNGQTEASSQVGGPVAIFFVLKEGSSVGWNYILFIIAVVSLTLAIMNILPIPALDGGRLWLTLFTRAIKKPLTPRREELINLYGFAFLMLLFILITVVDVKRFF